MKVLRRKAKWPCFKHSQTRFGVSGFRARGFHEKCFQNQPSLENKRSRLELEKKCEQEIKPEDENQHQARDDKQQLTKYFPVANLPVTLLEEEANSKEATKEEEANAFFHRATIVITKFHQYGKDAWEAIHNLAKFFYFSRGHFDQLDMTAAENIFQEFCLKFPKHGVLINYPLAKVYSDRVIFINELAEQVFGKIGVKDGGVKRKLFPASEEWKALKLAITCWMYPRQDHEITYILTYADGVNRKTRCWVTLYPELAIYVVHGWDWCEELS